MLNPDYRYLRVFITYFDYFFFFYTCILLFYSRKVSKAAMALVPLLGITNFILVILPEPYSKSPELFALWSYSAYILHSFQGLMVSILYCFINRDVSILKFKSNAFYNNYRINYLLIYDYKICIGITLKHI